MSELANQIERLSAAATPGRRPRPCPFCGATPHHGLGKVQHCQLHGDPFQDFSIWCPHGCAKITRGDGARAWKDWEGSAPQSELSPALLDLLEYGRHKVACADWQFEHGNCDCGFSDARNNLPQIIAALNAQAEVEALRARAAELEQLLHRAIGSTSQFGLPWVKDARKALEAKP